MRKIAYCIPGLYSPSGMENVLTAKVNYLAETGHYDIYIVTTEMNGRSPYYPLNSSVKVIDLNINFDEDLHKPIMKKIFSYYKKQTLYRKRMEKCLCEVKPHITISLLRRDIDFINKIKDGSKKIGEIHFNKSNYREFNKKYFPMFINKFITKLWRKKLIGEIKKLDRFVVLTNEDKKEWKELTNIQVIYNSLPDIPKENCDYYSKKILAVGRYTYQKGYDLLLKAWGIVEQRHPDWELHVYGNGDNLSMQKRVNENGLRSMFCHEATRDIDMKYKESSIFVLSSRYEGFGMVLAEAMSWGLAAVSFACPCGPKDIINNGEDGFLVEKENISELADKLCYLIENESIRKKTGERAKVNIARFSQEIIMKQWIELFHNVIDP